jgi:hypothetical protein
MFLVPADRPGIRLIRHVTTMDKSMLGGHCEHRGSLARRAVRRYGRVES